MVNTWFYRFFIWSFFLYNIFNLRFLENIFLRKLFAFYHRLFFELLKQKKLLSKAENFFKCRRLLGTFFLFSTNWSKQLNISSIWSDLRPLMGKRSFSVLSFNLFNSLSIAWRWMNSFFNSWETWILLLVAGKYLEIIHFFPFQKLFLVTLAFHFDKLI